MVFRGKPWTPRQLYSLKGMTMKNFHVTKNEKDEWQFKPQKGAVIDTAETKAEMLEIAIAHVKDVGGSLKIHKEDGTFQEERTYPGSADPAKSKG